MFSFSSVRANLSISVSLASSLRIVSVEMSSDIAPSRPSVYVSRSGSITFGSVSSLG